MALTAEQEAELLTLSPADLVKKLKDKGEILDRHDARATAAEAARVALEKKIMDEAEAARVATLSEIEKAKAEVAKEKKLREDAEAATKREKGTALVSRVALRAGAIDDVDVMRLLPEGVIGQEEAAVTEAVNALKTKYPALFGAQDDKYQSGQHGRGGGNRGGQSGVRDLKRSAFDAMSPTAKMDYIKKGGTVTD